MAWRVYLRSKNYLAPIADSTTQFTSLSGLELSDSLLNMTEIGETLRKKNLGIIGQEEEVAPIFVTDDERKEYLEFTNKRLPKDKLIQHVESLLPEISNDEVREDLQDDWVAIRNKNKSEILKFYQQISELVNLQVPNTPDEPELPSD